MDTVSSESITEIENVWITLADGCRLAARLWLPDGVERAPAVLEYIPYRKRDFMRLRDEPIHRYFAVHGLVSVRVDLRGTGDSDGILTDEYTQAELDDALEVIAWIAEQPWCSGAVGMMGISWGGFNSLQVAALNPPALKAVITLCCADDRYSDDAHYMGGCLLNENMQWGSILLGYGAYPPDPQIVGDGWRRTWRQRIDAIEPFPAVWMRHQRRDEYWQHGSVCEDYAAIRCAVYAIGGWADGYSNAIPRLLEGLSCPRKALIGPWSHNFPHKGVPGPAIGFLQEAMRWWGHWLRNEDNGIMDEPVYRAWMQESVPPQPHYAERPGRWVAESSWPSPRIEPRTLHLAPGRLGEGPGAGGVQSICSPQTTGVRSGDWCGFGMEGELPRDQRPDDGASLCFDTAPLPQRLEILGAPAVSLTVRADRPNALLAARLVDVAPDGAGTLVTYGLLNLTHRDGHESPAPIEPGVEYRVRISLNDIAHAFPPGHRIRLAISTSFWPMVWPSPEPACVTIEAGRSDLALPVRPPSNADRELRRFERPEGASSGEQKKLRRLPLRRTIEVDLATNETVHTLYGDGGELGGASLARIEAIDLDLGYTFLRRYRIIETDPLSAQTEIVQRTSFKRADWQVRIECRTRLTATIDGFQFSADLDAFEGEELFAHRDWQITLPRDLV